MDTESLLRLLNDHKVKYVIIGAFAFPIHGYSRVTEDIDIFIEPTRDNAENVHRALIAFGYDMSDITVDELLTKKILVRNYSVETDTHPFVTGITFEEVWAHRVEGNIGTATAGFASLDDLIKMKKAAGRGKDLQDIHILEKLKGKKERKDK